MTTVQYFSQVIYDHDANYLTGDTGGRPRVYALGVLPPRAKNSCPVLAALIAGALALALPRPSFGINCAGTSTGRIPLTDLATGMYQGFQGGLYTGGVNSRPDAHRQAGL